MGEPRKGKRAELLDALTVERAQYVELRSKGAKASVIDPRTGKPRQSREGALLGNRLPDGLGLYLYITPGNSKSWRFDYRYHGQRRVLVYGSFPDLSLKQARALHAEARLQLAKGLDPVEERKKRNAQTKAELQKAADEKKNTFRTIADEWLNEELKAKPRSDVWCSNIERWIGWANDAFGNRPLPDIEAPDVLRLIKKIAESTPASAEFCRQTISRIFNYGIRTLRAPRGFNPSEAVRGAVIVPQKKHRPKLEAKELPALLLAIDTHDGPESVKIGLKILLHCFPRKDELAEAPWTEIDLDAGLWTISAARMKMKRDHVIPLSRQLVMMCRRLKELAADSPFVFPSRHRHRTEPMTGQTFNYFLNKSGYKGKFGPHGARATAASLLADAGFDVHVIDAQLAHEKKDKTQAAYFRNTYVDKRRELLQWWSDLLDSYASGASNVIPFGASKAA